MTASTAPTVLPPVSLAALLSRILTTQTQACPTTILVCSSRESFLPFLVSSFTIQGEAGEAGEAGEGAETERLHQALAPTLHNLHTTSTVRVVFCDSVQGLLAYLSAFDGSGLGGSGEHARGSKGVEQGERMFLVNPLALHSPSPSFSAQGLSRTFAAAVEASVRAKTQLFVVECAGMQREQYHVHDQDDVPMQDDEDGAQEDDHENDPWEQHVSILNVSARRFGSASGRRAWAGRTVTAKRIAARWFQFEQAVAST